ncbi:hypothetical protein Bbelb_371230 [Branchiostoma belcheri]|nr:hypothetical protein Bbelb_371230 [Branchiostoma belcheri]
MDSIQDSVDPSQTNAQVYADMHGYTTNGGTIPVHILPTTQKPDLVIHLPEQNIIHLYELTVPFEQNIKRSHDRKTDKYAALVADLETAGITTTLNCFEVGSRGLITPENKCRLKNIFKTYRSRDKHHRDSGFCGISRGSLRDITRETAGYPAGVCGISRGRLRDIPRYSFGRPVVSRVPRSEKTWCETPKSTAARNGDGGVPNVYFYVLPGDLCWADGV